MQTLFLPLLLSGLFSAAPPAGTREQAAGLLTRTVSVGGESYTYQVYVPAQLRGRKDVPVLVFLHGIGQRGEGGFVPAGGAAGALAGQYLEQVPAVVLLPQCRRGQYWHDPQMERMVLAALGQTVDEFGGDARRLYLAGVSMGGYGAWHLAAEHAGKFAAVVPICGGSPLRAGDRFGAVARKVGRTPVWIFHGSDDRVVPVSESRGMAEALRGVEGSRVRYNEFEGVGHNVWLNALAEPGLLPWVLEQRLD